MANGPRTKKRRAPRRRGGTLPSLVATTLGTPALTRLPPREQEVATIVYLHTEVTARDLEQALSSELTNSAIRCMLARLVAKGVLRRRKGPGRSFFYSPALLAPDVQERAHERLAEEYFAGSLYNSAIGLFNLMHKREPQMAAMLARHFEMSTSSVGPAQVMSLAGRAGR